MNYRACYHCELLYEADETARCPQCDRMLAPYVPDDGGSGGSVKASERAKLAGEVAHPADRREEMVPVSRSEWPEQIDGGRRSGYGRRPDGKQQDFDYERKSARAQMEGERPQNRALPGQPEERREKRNTGSFRLGRSESPARRGNEWREQRSARNTREVDLRGPSSPKAPRASERGPDQPRGRVDVALRDNPAAPSRPAPRSPGGGHRSSLPGREDPAGRDAPRAATPQRSSIPPRSSIPAAGPPGAEMESTRMLSAIDLARGAPGLDPAALDRTRMVSTLEDEATLVPDAPTGEAMERTRMLSAIDLARGAPPDPELDRTRMHGALDDEITSFRRPPAAPAPGPDLDNERTRMRSVIHDIDPHGQPVFAPDAYAPAQPAPAWPGPAPRGAPDPGPSPYPAPGPS
ncbi:MAG: hypothetical protein H6703_16530, partial [Myxococcales bacterium]|nr:hypothetical protein [Myxococcales bacterium]